MKLSNNEKSMDILQKSPTFRLNVYTGLRTSSNGNNSPEYINDFFLALEKRNIILKVMALIYVRLNLR